MNDYDPFRAPAADLGAKQRTAQLPGDMAAAVPAEVIEALRQTKPWVAFLGWTSIVMMGLMVLGGLTMSAVSLVAGPSQKAGLPAWIGLPYLALAGIYLFPTVMMLRYSGAIRRLTAGGGVDALIDALQRQKAFWKFIGIMTIVLLGLYGLFIAGAIMYGISTAMGQH
jgi:hypothetical protein